MLVVCRMSRGCLISEVVGFQEGIVYQEYIVCQRMSCIRGCVGT